MPGSPSPWACPGPGRPGPPGSGSAWFGFEGATWPARLAPIGGRGRARPGRCPRRCGRGCARRAARLALRSWPSSSLRAARSACSRPRPCGRGRGPRRALVRIVVASASAAGSSSDAVVGGGRPRPRRSAGASVGPGPGATGTGGGCRCLVLGAAAAAVSGGTGPSADGTDGRRHAGQLEDEVDDVGLLGPRPGLAAEGGGDGVELVAVLALERRAFEFLCVRAHGCLVSAGSSRRWVERPGGRSPGGPITSDRGLENTGTTVKERVGGRLDGASAAAWRRLPLHQREPRRRTSGIRWEVRRGSS